METMNFGYHKMYFEGKMLDAESNKRTEVICPATENPVAEIVQARAEDAERALMAAQRGFEKWSSFSLAERTDWMLKLR